MSNEVKKGSQVYHGEDLAAHISAQENLALQRLGQQQTRTSDALRFEVKKLEALLAQRIKTDSGESTVRAQLPEGVAEGLETKIAQALQTGEPVRLSPEEEAHLRQALKNSNTKLETYATVKQAEAKTALAPDKAPPRAPEAKARADTTPREPPRQPPPPPRAPNLSSALIKRAVAFLLPTPKKPATPSNFQKLTKGPGMPPPAAGKKLGGEANTALLPKTPTALPSSPQSPAKGGSTTIAAREPAIAAETKPDEPFNHLPGDDNRGEPATVRDFDAQCQRAMALGIAASNAFNPETVERRREDNRPGEAQVGRCLGDKGGNALVKAVQARAGRGQYS